MKEELVIEYHKPTPGEVRITGGDEVIIMTMVNYDKLPADPEKRKEQLREMLYGR